MVSSLFPVQVSGALVQRRKKRLLGPVDVTLESRGITMVVGPNGAGKTTFLKVLHGIERLSAGSVTWAVPTHEAQHRQAYVFQRPIMLRRSVRENLAYPLHLSGVGRTDIATRCSEWAKQIGLADALDRPATRLSGGEQQKLALARALINDPEVLFLDEPCANLDGPATRDIESILQSAHASGTRIIMTTHDLGQLRRLATDVIFLLNGEIHETGAAPDVFAAPETPALASFFKGDIVG